MLAKNVWKLLCKEREREREREYMTKNSRLCRFTGMGEELQVLVITVGAFPNGERFWCRKG